MKITLFLSLFFVLTNTQASTASSSNPLLLDLSGGAKIKLSGANLVADDFWPIVNFDSWNEDGLKRSKMTCTLYLTDDHHAGLGREFSPRTIQLAERAAKKSRFRSHDDFYWNIIGDPYFNVLMCLPTLDFTDRENIKSYEYRDIHWSDFQALIENDSDGKINAELIKP